MGVLGWGLRHQQGGGEGGGPGTLPERWGCRRCKGRAPSSCCRCHWQPGQRRQCPGVAPMLEGTAACSRSSCPSTIKSPGINCGCIPGGFQGPCACMQPNSLQAARPYHHQTPIACVQLPPLTYLLSFWGVQLQLHPSPFPPLLLVLPGPAPALLAAASFSSFFVCSRRRCSPSRVPPVAPGLWPFKSRPRRRGVTNGAFYSQHLQSRARARPRRWGGRRWNPRVSGRGHVTRRRLARLL